MFQTVGFIFTTSVTGVRIASGAYMFWDVLLFGIGALALFVVLPCILFLPARPKR